MKKTLFTDKMIKALKPESTDYSRSEGNGFTVRVMPSGVKTWLYVYAFDGKRRKMNLGQYPAISLEDARSRFEDARRQVKNGVDPLAAAEQAKVERIKAPTVADLIDEYIEKHAKPHKRGWAEDKRILERDALPAWGKRKAADITKRDVVLLLEKIVERGSPGSANNNFKIIRKMFNYAVEKDILQISPCIGVKMPSPLVIKDRSLSEQEISTLWRALDTCHASDEIKRALKLILVTGQRPGEVIGMHTNEIAIERKTQKNEKGQVVREWDEIWWTIPAERSKNKPSHRVYLTKTALELIGPECNGYVFPSPRTALKPIEVNALAHVVRRNLKSPVKINGQEVFGKDGQPVTENKLGVDTFTPHDLRRTAATMLSEIGFLDERIAAVLNHTKQGVIKTYNRNRYEKEKQQALEAWERKLLSIVTGTAAGKVVPIKRAA